MKYEGREVAFGPFEFAFEPIRGGGKKSAFDRFFRRGTTDGMYEYGGGQGELMGISPNSVPLLDAIRSVVSHPDAADCVITLLRDPSWGPQLVGAVATYASPFASAVTQAWRAFDSGSWVSPQLAAMLSLVDPDFATLAIDRLEQRCPLSHDQDYEILSAMERAIAQGTSGGYLRSCKAAAALLALLDTDIPRDRRTLACRDDPELQRLIADDKDQAIATRWRAGLILHWGTTNRD